jgi:hypothetical protein
MRLWCVADKLVHSRQRANPICTAVCGDVYNKTHYTTQDGREILDLM